MSSMSAARAKAALDRTPLVKGRETGLKWERGPFPTPVRIRRPKTSIVAAAELPSIVTLGPNLFAASFPLMKLLPARFIMDRARDEGTLKPGAVVIETSSGTFGLGLAMVCNQRGHKCILVSDPAIDPPLRRRLEELGATV